MANLDRFFRELTRDLCDGGAGTQEILRRLRTRVAEAVDAEEGRPESGATPGVRVMTIHQSKGLGFDHVYVVQLQKGQPWNPLWDGTLASRVDGDWEYSLFGAATLRAWRVAATRAEVDAAERVRTLYVAMTRAKDRLVLSGVWPEGRDTRPPEQARHHLDLLLHRDPGVPDLAQLAESVSKSGAPDRGADAEAARWRFPALEPATDGATGADDPDPSQRTEPAEVRAEAGLLRARRRRPAREWRERSQGQRQTRHTAGSTSFGAEPADGDPAGARSRRADRHGGGERRAPGPRGPRPEGGAGGRAPSRRGGRSVPASSGLVTHEQRERAFERANDCLERFWTGPLLGRLRDLAGSVVARELS